MNTSINEAKIENNDKKLKKSIICNITTVFLGLAVTLSLMLATSWAWFVGEASSSGNVIESSYCNVAVSVKDNTSSEVFTNASGNYEYTLDPDTYTVTLTANGTATSGYCKIVINGTEYYTEQIATDSAAPNANYITFTVTVSEITVFTVEPKWGCSSQTKRDFYDGFNYNY